MPSHLPAQSIRVLLVEDDPDDQWLITDLLTRLDGTLCTVDVAGGMAQALELLAEHRHDVALIDYQLGAFSGLDLLHASANDPARPPMILLTGYGTAELDRRALAAGAADYLVKGDLGQEQLARTIRYALERHRLSLQLARREQEYRLLFSTSPMPMWLYAIGTLQILEVNAAACAQYGYTREEMLALTIADLREPGERAHLLQFLDQLPRSSGHLHAGVWRHRRKDGSTLDVEIVSSELAWHGAPARLVAAHDVSARRRAEAALRASEQTLRGVLNDLSDGLVVVGDAALVRFVNPAACALLGRSEADLVGSALDHRTLLQGADQDELVSADGQLHSVSMRVSETSWHGEQAAVITLIDITQERAIERELALLQRSVAATSDGVLIVDAVHKDAPIIYANPAFERITGYRIAEVLGRNCRFLQADDREQPALDQVRQALAQQQSCTVVLRNYRKDGSLFWNRLTLAPVRDAHGQVRHYIGVMGDISEQKFLEAERNYLATHDPVTALPRYSGAEQGLETLLARSRAAQRQLVLMLIDLDGFHSVNDTLGYQMGDAALRLIADRLRQLAGPDAEIVRYAGDEFLAVFGNLDAGSDALALANAVCERIAEPLPVTPHATLYLTASVGATQFAEGAGTLVELVRQADLATHRAKRNGRNGAYVFGSELREALNDRLALGGRLRSAISRGEFLLHYQPQVDARDGSIVAVEALVRWNSPEFGLLPPRRFVPVAEDSGVIVQLGLHILETACRQARAWMDARLPRFLVSVNVSAAQIQRPSFVTDVRRVIHETGVAPGMLELEITESVLMDNTDRAIEQLRQLKAIGVRLALDDFGMGYSSLGYLRRFPIDKLKIDQAFIQDITTSGPDAALVRAIIAMGHHLGMRVVAEGVETEAQCGYLRRCHCDEFQGYYFSKPLPADAIPALLHKDYSLALRGGADYSQRTLLLLDDEENILRALVRVFRRDGYQILCARSAAEAFSMLALQEVQVILSDQRMPGISGTEFLSQVKQMYPQTVRIVLSGYTDLASVTDAVNRGAIYKFLTKPWDDDALRAQVQEAFRRFDQERGEPS